MVSRVISNTLSSRSAGVACSGSWWRQPLRHRSSPVETVTAKPLTRLRYSNLFFSHPRTIANHFTPNQAVTLQQKPLVGIPAKAGIRRAVTGPGLYKLRSVRGGLLICLNRSGHHHFESAAEVDMEILFFLADGRYVRVRVGINTVVGDVGVPGFIRWKHRTARNPWARAVVGGTAGCRVAAIRLRKSHRGAGLDTEPQERRKIAPTTKQAQQ